MAEINNPEFGVRRLDEHERIESFDCGDADLNDFIAFGKNALLTRSV